MDDRKTLAMKVTMLAVERRVLPLKDETAVEHAKRLFEIAEQCMAACLPEEKVEPPAAAPAAQVDWEKLSKSLIVWKNRPDFVWKVNRSKPGLD